MGGSRWLRGPPFFRWAAMAVDQEAADVQEQEPITLTPREESLAAGDFDGGTLEPNEDVLAERQEAGSDEQDPAAEQEAPQHDDVPPGDGEATPSEDPSHESVVWDQALLERAGLSEQQAQEQFGSPHTLQNALWLADRATIHRQQQQQAQQQQQQAQQQETPEQLSQQLAQQLEEQGYDPGLADILAPQFEALAKERESLVNEMNHLKSIEARRAAEAEQKEFDTTLDALPENIFGRGFQDEGSAHREARARTFAAYEQLREMYRMQTGQAPTREQTKDIIQRAAWAEFGPQMAELQKTNTSRQFKQRISQSSQRRMGAPQGGKQKEPPKEHESELDALKDHPSLREMYENFESDNGDRA